MPNTLFDFFDGRTEDRVRQVVDMSLDLALVREDAVARPLRLRRLFLLTYSLFVPKRQAGSIRGDNLKAAMERLPLATSLGGQYRQQLTTATGKAGWPLRIELSCSSFTQAAQTVRTGAFAAALPDMEGVAFGADEVVKFPLPLLKSHARPVCVAWTRD